MNRKDFINLLEQYGIVFHRHGSRHDVYIHKITGKKVAVPRHNEIKNKLLNIILKEVSKKDD